MIAPINVDARRATIHPKISKLLNITWTLLLKKDNVLQKKIPWHKPKGQKKHTKQTRANFVYVTNSTKDLIKFNLK